MALSGSVVSCKDVEPKNRHDIFGFFDIGFVSSCETHSLSLVS